MAVKVKDIYNLVTEGIFRISTWDNKKNEGIMLYDEDTSAYLSYPTKIPKKLLNQKVSEIYVYNALHTEEFQVVHLVIGKLHNPF